MFAVLVRTKSLRPWRRSFGVMRMVRRASGVAVVGTEELGAESSGHSEIIDVRFFTDFRAGLGRVREWEQS